MCLIMLQESETVYFEESLKTAQEAVAEALGQFNGLLDSLDETERGKLQRSMGMKMEQLKVRCGFFHPHGRLLPLDRTGCRLLLVPCLSLAETASKQWLLWHACHTSLSLSASYESWIWQG